MSGKVNRQGEVGGSMFALKESACVATVAGYSVVKLSEKNTAVITDELSSCQVTCSQGDGATRLTGKLHPLRMVSSERAETWCGGQA